LINRDLFSDCTVKEIFMIFFETKNQ